MEQRVRCIVAGIMVLMAVLAVGSYGNVAEAAPKLEQAYIHSPTIRTYLTESDKSQTEDFKPELYFDDTELSYQEDVHVYDSSKDGGTEYIYVVEISKNVTKKQRTSIETALRKAVDELEKSDEMTVYTFGDKFSAEKPVKISGNAGAAEKKKARDGIHRLLRQKEKTSHLWNAVTNVTERINKDDAEGPQRRVAVFVTGGNYKKSTSNNDKEDVKKQIASVAKNAAFYMIQMKTKSKIDGSEASVFTESGGQKFSEKTDGGIFGCFTKIHNMMDKTIVATFQASDSTVFEQSGSLTMRVNGESVCENKTIAPAYSWQENTAEPVLVPVAEGGSDLIKKEDEYTISFSFSEPVKGAEVIKNYDLVRGEGEQVEIKSLKYDVKTYQCQITLEQEIFTDTYQLTFSNITDVDHTPLAVEPTQVSFEMEGTNEQVYDILQFLKSYWWIFLIAAAVMILMIVYLVIRSHGGIVEQEDGKKGFANATTITVGISTPKTKKIVLMMTDSFGKSKEIICNIDSSIFVGRDRMCQIHTDDDKMSRQHFAIESTQLGFFIMDLDTLNGTLVNGKKLTNRQMLKEGDVISAGREKFVFNLYKGE
mgnify:CR=1 FL=1